MNGLAAARGCPTAHGGRVWRICRAAIANDPLLSAVTMEEAEARYILLTGMSTVYQTATELFDLFNAHMPVRSFGPPSCYFLSP